MTYGTKEESNRVLHESGYFIGRWVKKQWLGADNPVYHSTLNKWECGFSTGDYGVLELLDPLTGNVAAYLGVGGDGSYGYASYPEFGANDTIKIIAGLGANIRGHDAHLGKMLGEADGTLDIIRDTAVNVGRAIERLRRGNMSAAARCLGVKLNRKDIVKTVADAWLQLQYGWLPLLDDAATAAEAFASLQTPNTAPMFSSGTKVYNQDSIQDDFIIAERSATIAVRYSVGCVDPLDPVKGLVQLHLDDPMGVVWELLPFSFVFDWFVPIGTYLEATSTLQTFNLTTGFSTRKNVRRTNLSPGDNPNYGTNIIGKAGGEQVSYDRRVLRDLTLPAPTVKPIGSSLSRGHCTNALALIASIGKKFIHL